MTDKPTVKLTLAERDLLDYFIADWRDAREYNIESGSVIPEREPSERLYRELLAGDEHITEVAEMKEALRTALDMAETVGKMSQDKIAAFYALIKRCDKALEVYSVG